MKAAFFGLVAVAGIVCSQEQELTDPMLTSFVVSGKNAYFMAPAKLITDGEVQSIMFTPEGRYGLLRGRVRSKQSADTFVRWLQTQQPQEQEPAPFSKIWDIETGTVREINPAILGLVDQFKSGEMGSFNWTPTPGVAIIANDEVEKTGPPQFHIRKVNVVDGTMKEIKAFPNSGFMEAFVSPTRPIIVVLSEEFSKTIDNIGSKTKLTFTFIDLDGRVLKAGSQSINGRVNFGFWTVDGLNLVGRSSLKTAPGVKPVYSTQVLNSQTGVVSETKEDIKTYGEQESETELELSDVWSKVSFGGADRMVKSLWLAPSGRTSDKPALVVGEFNGESWLAPNLKTIAYVDNGRLFARDVAKVDLETYKKALIQAQRAAALRHAHQVGIAVMIYSADTDDVLPLANGFEDAILPYIKNRESLNGFVYLLNGQNMTTIKDVSTTEMGYISTPGGRVVVYVDGSAKFVPNP